MTLSRSAAYAISALAYIAAQAGGRRCGLQEICAHQGIPMSFLGKILQVLRRRGLLRSVRGIGGGYQLGAPPETIRLATIVEALGESTKWDQCVLLYQGCSEDNPCVLHHRWASLRSQFVEMLETTSVAELASSAAPGRAGDFQQREAKPA